MRTQYIHICETCRREYTSEAKHQKYCCIGHMPRSVKQAAGRKGRERGARTKRLQRFHLEIARLPQRLMREDLLVLFQRVYFRGYKAGVQQRRSERV